MFGGGLIVVSCGTCEQVRNNYSSVELLEVEVTICKVGEEVEAGGGGGCVTVFTQAAPKNRLIGTISANPGGSHEYGGRRRIWFCKSICYCRRNVC